MAQPEISNAGNIKVLSVVWYKVLRPKFGGQKAVAFFNEHLALHVPLICLCSKNNEEMELPYQIRRELPISKRQFLNPLVWRKIYLTAKKEGVTHLILEFPYHGIAGYLCKKWLGINLVVNTHNIEFLRFKEQKKWWWGPLFHLERWTLKKADVVFFKTDYDRQLALHYFHLKANKLFVVPYAVEEKPAGIHQDSKDVIRLRHQIKEEEKILLFAGTLDYQPNAEAVISIKEKLIPLLDLAGFQFKIIVSGRNLLKSFRHLNQIQSEKLIMAGEVEDIDLYFSAADVFINPVLRGGGIQTKNMDALSHHLNVVCFESKSFGIANADNKILRVKDGDWKGFVSAIINASKTSGKTPATFFETYNWRTIAANAFQKLVTL